MSTRTPVERRGWNYREWGMRYGYGPQTVRKMVREGRIEALEDGPNKLITADAERRWLASLPRCAPAEAA